MKKFWKWAVILMTATMAAGLASRLIRKYRTAVRLFDETQSDDIGSYIDWLSLFTWWQSYTGSDAAFSTSLADWAKSFAVSDICAGNHQYTL